MDSSHPTAQAVEATVVCQEDRFDCARSVLARDFNWIETIILFDA